MQKESDALDPMLIPEIAHKAHVDVAMLDTAIKDGKNLFDFLNDKQLKKFVDSSHLLWFGSCLGWFVEKTGFTYVYGLGADIAGVRGAACTNSDRVTGEITEKQVASWSRT